MADLELCSDETASITHDNVVIYIALMLVELANMARGRCMHRLSYLIDIAQLEALEMMDRMAPPLNH